MAHFCPDCRRTFNAHIANCPLCGYSIVSNDQPEEFYLNMGYTRFGAAPQRTASLASNHTNDGHVRINDSDILDQIRNGYNTYVDDLNNRQPTTPPVSNTQQPQTSTGENFFGSFSSNTLRTPETQPEPAPEPAVTRPPVTNRTPNAGTTQHGAYHSPGRRGFGVRRFFNGAGRFLSAVPWRAVLYILLAIGIIVGISFLWQQRFAILESIIGFLIALLPLGLLIGGIIWVIRNLFR